MALAGGPVAGRRVRGFPGCRRCGGGAAARGCGGGLVGVVGVAQEHVGEDVGAELAEGAGLDGGLQFPGVGLGPRRIW